MFDSLVSTLPLTVLPMLQTVFPEIVWLQYACTREGSGNGSTGIRLVCSGFLRGRRGQGSRGYGNELQHFPICLQH